MDQRVDWMFRMLTGGKGGRMAVPAAGPVQAGPETHTKRVRPRPARTAQRSQGLRCPSPKATYPWRLCALA